MKKYFNLIFILIFLSSCANKQELIINKYWVKYKSNQPKLIVKFTKDGKFINYNKLEQIYTYSIIQNRLVITDSKGERKKYFIKSLTNNTLKLSEIIEVGNPEIEFYRAAKLNDYFLGKWIYAKNNTFYAYEFSGNYIVNIDETVNNITQQKKLKYTVKNDSTIQIGSQKFNFIFENDIKKLILTTPNKETITLNRI